MKRSKRDELPTPSSSTPATSRQNLELSPAFSCLRDSDTDNSIENCGSLDSPVLKGSHSPVRYSPLGSAESSKRSFYEETSSPDGHVYNPDMSGVSVGKGYLSDHLQHSLSYARCMEQRALNISTRLTQTANLTMGPRFLFAPRARLVNYKSDCKSGESKKLSLVDDLNAQSYLTISQQTTSTVERYARLADVCPDLLNSRTVNRFMMQHTPGENQQEERPIGMNPIFNCCTNCNFFFSSSIEMLNEVQALALLQHTNIIRFYSSWYEADSIYTQLELCLGGSLFNLLHPDRQHDTSETVAVTPKVCIDERENASPKSDLSCDANRNYLSEKPLIILASHILSALHYMHTNWSVVHGDVKPSNVLIQLSRPEAYLAAAQDSIEMDAKRYCHKVSF
ncbi:unnamed protein product [Trichobilharzia regenti]|nr:unnamed protein product [Trichobilharzia regenti]